MPNSFYRPAEPDWHRWISEAAYYRAERREFARGQDLQDWLSAEEDVRLTLRGPASAEPPSKGNEILPFRSEAFANEKRYET